MYIYIYTHSLRVRYHRYSRQVHSLSASRMKILLYVRWTVQSIVKFFSPIISRGRGNSPFFSKRVQFRRKKGDDQRLINIRLTIRSSIHQVESKVWYRGALLVKFWQKKKKIDSTIQTVVQSCAGKLESYTGRFSFSSVYNTPPRSYRCSWSISHPVRTGQRF